MNPHQLNPQGLRAVLKESNIGSVKSDGDSEDLREILDEVGLGKKEVLMELSNLMKVGETGSIRLGAAKEGLKLNGLGTSDEVKPSFQVNIVINGADGNINPILIPRT